MVWGWCQSDHYCDKTDWPRWSGDGANQIIIVTKTGIGLSGWGWCQSDHYCDKNWNWPRWSGDGANQIVIVTKTGIGLGGLGMVPIRSLL